MVWLQISLSQSRHVTFTGRKPSGLLAAMRLEMNTTHLSEI